MNLDKVKRFAAELAMEDGGCAHVIVDLEAKGVETPPSMKTGMGEFWLGYDLDPPIPDLWIDDKGVVGTMAFQTGEHTVKFPWSAVCFVHDGDPKSAVVFPSGGVPDKTPPMTPMPTPPKPGRHLQLVPPDTQEAA
jgi:hypothetical protein